MGESNDIVAKAAMYGLIGGFSLYWVISLCALGWSLFQEWCDKKRKELGLVDNDN